MKFNPRDKAVVGLPGLPPMHCQIVRQSKATGQYVVALLGSAGAWNRGDKLEVSPYELQRIAR